MGTGDTDVNETDPVWPSQHSSEQTADLRVIAVD